MSPQYPAEKLALEREVAQILHAWGFKCFKFRHVQKRRGYLFIREQRDGNCLDFLEREFQQPVREGVVLYPCGFGDWEPMRDEALRYAAALYDGGLTSVQTLLYPHRWNFMAYAFVPLGDIPRVGS